MKFILVHGTFAMNAKWTGRLQSLHRRLSARFPGATCDKGTWSGRNSAKTRKAVADELREEIGPGTILVGHSHGGNICLEAVRGLPDQRLVSAIVLLATPILHVTRRSAKQISSLRGLFVAALLALLPVGLLALVVESSKGTNSDFHETVGDVAFVILLMCLPAPIWLWTWLKTTRWRRRQEEKIRDKQKELLKEGHHDEPVAPPVLCITAMGDEAAGLLSWASRLSDLPLALLHRGCLGSAIGISFLIALALIMYARDWEDKALVLCLFVPVAVFGVISLVAVLSTLVVLFKFISGLLITGQRAALRTLIVGDSVLLTPPNCSQVTHIQVDTGHSLLRHAVYKSRQAEDEILKWLGDRFPDLEQVDGAPIGPLPCLARRRIADRVVRKGRSRLFFLVLFAVLLALVGALRALVMSLPRFDGSLFS